MIDPGRPTTLWVIATFGVAMLPQLLHMPLPVVLMTLLPVGWRLAAEWRGWKPLKPLPRHVLTVLALVVLFASYGDLSGRRSAVSLLTLMLAMKLIEGYRIRDARLVVSFSLFLCATQFLFSQGVLMPFYATGTVVVALVALTRLQRTEAWSFENGRPPPLKASMMSELGFGLRLLGIAVPAGLAFFLLFPRLATPLWGIPETTLDSKTGLSDSMSPGSIAQLFMDDSPAFRVTFDGSPPGTRDLYWRGPVFWNFDGKTWKGSFYGNHVAAQDVPEPAPSAWSYTVQLEPNERRWLFALDYPVGPPPDSRLTLDYQILRRDPVLQLTEYSIVSNPDFVDSPHLPLTLRQQALDLPGDSSPRARELVARWRAETADDRSLVQRALELFNGEPFRYSLDVPLLGSQPVDEFLFETRAGYCEHYASSFTVLMRLAGIPARVVTGYMGGWYNPLGEYWLVRQSDAHAWAEVWLEGSGWTRVDPTAAVSPARIEQGSLTAYGQPRHLLDYGWFRSLRNSADIVQQRWNDWVIDYGAARQARLFEPLGLGRMGPRGLVAVLGFVLVLTGVVVIPILLRIRGPSYRDPAQKLWQKVLRRLERAGFSAPASAGALEVAEAAAPALPSAARSLAEAAGLYTRCRYAPGPPPLADLRQAVRRFRPKRRSA